jgi:hypothetical protein
MGNNLFRKHVVKFKFIKYDCVLRLIVLSIKNSLKNYFKLHLNMIIILLSS